ncbi:MAG: class I SAM-dependent methyltransferase [Clostridia bacterium]|nr:class I SAM-dependent methyltransferase [Clostridia bacterium]
MNTVWSDFVQGTDTLYLSRALRFDDTFREQYIRFLRLDVDAGFNALEVGCGPGALCAALKSWYPKANVTGLDRDSAFVAFAKENVPGVRFMEGDACRLPFEDASFDLTISNTVSEHVEPGGFFGEQFRVLKSGGVCAVFSSRRGIHVEADCLKDDEFERSFWSRAAEKDDSFEKYAVCRYPMNESQLPAAMEKYGFGQVETDYAVVPLTPDDPRFSGSMARRMIEAVYREKKECLSSVPRTLPGLFTAEELERMDKRLEEKFALRFEQLAKGEKQWDTSVSLIMMIRGVKP